MRFWIEYITYIQYIFCIFRGLIPPWNKSPDLGGLSTNNARLENLGESKLYRPALAQGGRCVVICDGFYEWKALGETAGKQPYVVYAAQQKEAVVKNQSTVKADDVWDGHTYKGQTPLFMAGIYSKWQGPEAKEPVFSYSVITR